MKKYEFVFILKPGLSLEATKKLLPLVKEEIKKSGGEIVSEEKWGEKSLAYPIKGISRGEYYSWTLSFAEAPRLKDLNTFISREENILRSIFILKREKVKRQSKRVRK